MELEITIDEEVLEKLKNLEEYLPGKSQELYDFARYLSQKLQVNTIIYPGAFPILIKKALEDLRKETPQRGNDFVLIKGRREYTYGLLENKGFLISRTVFPEESAAAIDEVYEGLFRS